MIKKVIIAVAIALIISVVGGKAKAQAYGDQPYKAFSAANTNSTLVKSTPGSITTIAIVNTTATIYYFKLYNKATAPTCNSDTPVMTIPVLASTVAPTIIPAPNGIIFRTGIGFCLTGGLADNDNTNAATGVAINLTFR